MAVLRLTTTQLSLSGVRPLETSQGQAGTVVRQSPAAGTTVRPGSTVQLWIAQPLRVQPVTVPDLTGLTEAAGLGRLQRVKLQPGGIGTQETEQAPAGTVVRQSPAAGATVPPGSEVEIWIAQPPPVKPKPPTPTVSRVTVPDLFGLTAEAARGLLDGVQLQLAEAGDQGGGETTGRRVLTQQPPPGTEVPLGATVQVWLNEERTAPRFPWPWILIGAGLIGAGAAWRQRSAAKPTAALRMNGRPDPGEQGIETLQPIQGDWKIRLCPQGDAGEQQILPLNESDHGGK